MIPVIMIMLMMMTDDVEGDDDRPVIMIMLMMMTNDVEGDDDTSNHDNVDDDDQRC